MTTYTPRRAPSRRWWPALLPALLLGTLAPLSTAVAPTSEADTATRLVGLFRLTPGSCAGGKVSGTYLRMILPSGTANGPYMSNADSPCSDQSFTPLAPGTDGGLSTVAHQSAPTPAFDSSGNARASRITARAQYYGTAFATATSATEPQSGRSVPIPTVTLRGNSLTADLRAFTVSWNKQYFNQGAPKPDGSTPGNTKIAKGNYDPATRRFTLDWTSQVQGGPFDKFTGKWHLEGVFEPARSSDAGTSGSTGQTGSAPQGSVPQGSGAAPAPGPSPATGAPQADASGAVPVSAPPLAATDAGTVSAQGAPATRTVTQRHKEWQVSGPLTATAIGLAIFAIGLIVSPQVLKRRRSRGSRKAATS